MKTRNTTKYLIIGVGKFGYGFAQKLLAEGIKESDIYLVDENPEVAAKLGQDFSNVVEQKITDVSFLERDLPMNEIDIVLIGSSDFQFSTEVAYSLHVNKSKFNIKKIYAKARSEMHRKILIQFDINEKDIVIPEEEVGAKMALKSLFENQTQVVDFSGDYQLINLKVRNENLKGKTIMEISKMWHEQQGIREWNIVSITNNLNEVCVATSDKAVFINYWVSVFINKKDRKAVYNFFTNTKK